MLPTRCVILCVGLAACALPLRAQDVPAPPLPPGATETPAPGDSAAALGAPMPRADLERMYRHELEGLYRPADADKVHAAHQLIEHFFAAKKAVERKQIVKDLEATGLDPALLGRLCRIHMNWPALEGGGVYYLNERFGPHTVRYFLGVPKEYDRTRP